MKNTKWLKEENKKLMCHYSLWAQQIEFSIVHIMHKKLHYVRYV